MDSLDAIDKLIREFGVDEEFRMGLRAAWDSELAWEQDRVRARHPGTRGQYQRAVGEVYQRLRGWLGDGRLDLVPRVLADPQGWLPHHGLWDARLLEELLLWQGRSRPAAVWCGLWALRQRVIKERG